MIKQIYHPYWLWEDFKNGMWRKLTKEEEIKLLPKIIEFTGNYELYGGAMFEVIKEWKFSCEHNLSDLSVNRRAWLGHAACCFKCGWPEYMVREAWNQLTPDQQFKANMMADNAIREWELKYKNHAETQLRIVGF
jgi:hypothetical protein